MRRDSISNTFKVTTLLCLACSFMVSLVAVSLRSYQNANMEGYRMSKVLEVAGFSDDDIRDAGGVKALYDQRIETIIINLETGEADLEGVTAAMKQAGKELGSDALATYDQVWAARSKRAPVADPLPNNRKSDPAGLKWREKFSHVYILKSEDGKSVERYIFPIRGNGLYGVMVGYISLRPDLQTVEALTYYIHKETPGLGGEVNRPSWKALWQGKLVYDEQGEVKLEVTKGPAPRDSKFQVDGLTGATITSHGVTAMIQYWFGESGFRPFIRLQESGGQTSEGGGRKSEVGGRKAASRSGVSPPHQIAGLVETPGITIGDTPILTRSVSEGPRFIPRLRFGLGFPPTSHHQLATINPQPATRN